MSNLLCLCLFGFILLTLADDCTGPDEATIESCLFSKIYFKASKEHLESNGVIRILIKARMNGIYLSSRTIAIQTRTCSQEQYVARIIGRRIDGVLIDYSNKEDPYCFLGTAEPTYQTIPASCSPRYKVCPDNTYIYPDRYCNFEECSRSYTNSPTSYYYPTKSPSTLMYSLGVPIIAIVVVVFVAALVIFAIVKCYRRRQALSMQRINEVELSTTTATSGGTNYFMRSNAGPIASTHPVYLYSNQPADVSVPVGYVPVLQTNANVQISSDEMYARELQTKFDQGY